MRMSVLALWLCAVMFNAALASDSLRVRKVSMCHTGEACVSLAVLGNYAYTAGDTWLVVISIADPANPVVVGRSDTTPGLFSARAGGERVLCLCCRLWRLSPAGLLGR